jgi:phospholipase C
MNYALQQMLNVLGLQLFATSGLGSIKIDPDLARRAGRVAETPFVFRDDLIVSSSDVRLEDLSATVDKSPTSADPRVIMKAALKGRIDLGQPGLIGIRLTALDLTLTFILFSNDPPGANAVGSYIGALVTAAAKLEGEDEGLPEGKDIEDIERDIVKAIELMFLDRELRRTMFEYLTAGFTQLVNKDHYLWSIRADNKSVVVQHFRMPRPLEDPDVDPDDVLADAIAQLDGPHPAGAVPRGRPQKRAAASRSAKRSTRGAAVDEDPSIANLRKIDHIIVLMMENRSFDHMLGYLTALRGREDIAGLTGAEFNRNPDTGRDVKVNEVPGASYPFSPNHDIRNVLKQVNDGRMDGFLANFLERFEGVDPRIGMGYYSNRVLFAYDFIAANYAICDRWFASHPGATMPNRLCAMTGSTPIIDNFAVDDDRIGYIRVPSLFDFMTAGGISWTYHYHDVAFLRLLDRYRLDDRNVLPFKRLPRGTDAYKVTEIFFDRLERGKLPQVTFIDPDFVDVPPAVTANDDLAPADVRNGQKLIKSIYDALIASPLWPKTMFLVTYDEHGGFYDHLSPPGTPQAPAEGTPVPRVHPDGADHYGVRVPALVVSPWVPEAFVEHRIFDHTSIGKTILLRFARGIIPRAFGPRIAAANHLGVLLTNDEPRLAPPRMTADRTPPPTMIVGREREAGGTEFGRIARQFAVPVLKP